VCRAKANGRLGVKNLAVFIASLLAKWLWRCDTLYPDIHIVKENIITGVI